MGKIKKLLINALACVGVLGCAAVVGSKVEAKTPYCTYDVTNNGKTANWDFTTASLGSNYSINKMFDENVDGIGGSTKGKVAIKSSDKKLSNGGNSTIYLPVPSAESSGTISTLGNKTDFTRYGLVGENKLYDNKNEEQSVPFTAANVKFDSTTSKYYVEIAPGDGELKLQYLRVDLTSDDSYAASAAKVTVTLKDSSGNVLNTDNTVESGTAYTGKYIAWGVDSELYYDAEFQNKYDSSVLTEDTTLYVKMTNWTDIKNYSVTQAQIAKVAGLGCANDVKLTGTIYTVLKNCSFASDCILTMGEGSKTEKAVKMDVDKAGTLTVYTETGGKDGRSFKVLDSTSNEVATKTGNATWTDAEAKEYEERTLTYELEPGTYYIGGTNSMKIFSLSFEEAAPVVETVKLNSQFDNDAEKNAVRFIGTINAEDLAKVSEVKLDLTLSDGENSKTVTVSFDTVYTSITDLKGFGEAEGVYYIVLELTDLSDFRACTLNATLKVTIDGVEETATLAEAISLAVAE